MKEGSLNPNPTLDNPNNAHRNKILSKLMGNVYRYSLVKKVAITTYIVSHSLTRSRDFCHVGSALL